MKNIDETAGVIIGKASPATRDICRLLAQNGISTVVVPKEVHTTDISEITAPDHETHWSGQPGQDLFFNGWKLMF